MQNAPKISVIIPVYNVESFLEATLNSVFTQTFEDFEVIAVNDGSTDASPDILRSYAREHSRLTVIDQENAGQSAARNAAIRIARGEYLAFLDSDDAYLPTFLEELYTAAAAQNADIVCCNYYLAYAESGRRLPCPLAHRSCVLDRTAALRLLLRDTSLHFYFWNKLFRRSLFTGHGIEIPSICYEDIATTPRLFYYAERIVILKKPLYLYTKHPGSIMAINGHKRRVNDYVVSLGILRDFLESEHAYETYKGSFNYYARRCITASWLTIYRYHKAVGSYRGFLGNIRRCTRGVTRYIGRGYPQRAAREPVFPPVLPDGEPQKGGRNH